MASPSSPFGVVKSKTSRNLLKVREQVLEDQEIVHIGTANSNHRCALACNVPGHPDARREQILGEVVDRSATRLLDKPRRSVRVEIAQNVVWSSDRSDVLPTHAKIQSDSRQDAPIVLSEKRVAVIRERLRESRVANQNAASMATRYASEEVL